PTMFLHTYLTCTLHFCISFFTDTATTETYTLSLHDALPICHRRPRLVGMNHDRRPPLPVIARLDRSIHAMAREHRHGPRWSRIRDRKSTRLNSSHVKISYAVFCLKKKKEKNKKNIAIR